MTPFGRFACVSVALIAFAASDSARADAPDGSIHLQCDGPDLAPFCAALGNALQHVQPQRRVTLSANPETPHLTVRFQPTRQSAHLLSGFLAWRAASGQTGQGPEIELAVMDSVITDELLRNFAATLVQHSNIPL